MKRLLAMMIIMAAGLVFLTGCNNTGQEPANNSAGESLQKITILLDWVPNTNHTGLFAAQNMGYFAAEGLEAEIIQPGDGGTAQLIGAGTGEFGVSYQEDVTVARSEGIPVTAIAAVIQHNTSGFASEKAQNITRPADFSGKTYGGWGSPAENAIINAIMQKDNADFSTVNIMNIGSFDFFTSLTKGVDFAWIFQGWTGIEAEIRNVELNFIPVAEIDPIFDYYTPVLIASDKTIGQNPELVQKFMRAVSRGYDYCIEHPEAAAGILLEHAPELDQELVVRSQKYLSAEYKADAPRWGEMKAEVWQRYADFMYDNELIASNIEVGRAFTNDFLP